MKPAEQLLSNASQECAYSEHPRRMMLVTRVGQLIERYYPREEDAYRLFEREIAGHLEPSHTLLDAGCGRTAPVLSLFAPGVKQAIGLDLVDFDPGLKLPGMTLLKSDLSVVPLQSNSVDMIISRSVVEHLANPAEVQREFFRVLKPGGRFIFITPNVWSYPIMAARMVPNRFHRALVDWAEGRPAVDTFDTYHRSNSFRAIRRLAAQTGFTVCSMRYLNMFPNYLMFHPWAFRAGIFYDRTIRRIQCLNFLQHWILAVLLKPETAR